CGGKTCWLGKTAASSRRPGKIQARQRAKRYPFKSRWATKTGSSQPVSLTGVIPMEKEEKNLAFCLARIKNFLEELIVDSDSSDQTRKIAENAGAKVLNFKWQGGYPKKRNWVLLNYPFTTPWVLFLDADERLSDDFCGELSRRLYEDDYVGFWLNYR